jgi:hypothetical protein
MIPELDYACVHRTKVRETGYLEPCEPVPDAGRRCTRQSHLVRFTSDRLLGGGKGTPHHMPYVDFDT